jgi:hypothetical protein
MDRQAPVQTLLKLTQHRALGAAADLSEELIRQRHAFERGPCLQGAMQVVRDVAGLDHL